MNPVWTKTEIRVLKRYYGKIKFPALQEKLPNRTPNAIKTKACSFGLKADRCITRRIVDFNDNFFTKPNAENSYWAGFIAADGSIAKKRPTLSFYQSDRTVLERFQKSIKHNGKITHIKRDGHNHEYIVTITSKQIVHDLYVNFNITPNKSLTLKPPKRLSKKNARCFAVGYIDGDGSIMYNLPDCMRHRLKKKFLSFNVLGTADFLVWFKNVIGAENCRIYKRTESKNIFYMLIASHRKAAKVLVPLYYNSNVDNLRLKRKWSKVEAYINAA